MNTLVLEINNVEDGYRAVATSPFGGSASGEFQLPWTVPELDRLLERVADAVTESSAATRRTPTAEERIVQEFGSSLLQALPAPVRRLLRDAMRTAEMEGRPLAVALLAHPPELVRMPWEFLYDPDDDYFPFLRVPLVRCLSTDAPGNTWRTELPLRMLSMIGWPEGLAPEDEQRRLEAALGELVRDGLVTVDWVPGRGWRDLQERVRYGPRWNVLHYLGHGLLDRLSGEGSVELEGDDGQPYQMPASRLAVLLRGRPSIRLVVLNACDTGRPSIGDPLSSIAATLVRAHLPAVVAMQFRITDRAAIEFSQSFYRAVARRSSVVDSLTAARQDMQNALKGSLEWGTPVLYLPSPHTEAFTISGSVAWHPAMVTTIRAARDVNDVAFSPDNGQLVLACDGRRSRVVDTKTWTGRTARQLGANQYAVAFSPDGVWLVTGGMDGVARVWEAASGELVAELAHPDWVASVAVSPDREIATACGDGVARLWRVQAGEGRPEPYAHAPHDAPVRAVVFDPGGERIATASDDRTVRIWRTDGVALQRTIRHTAPVLGAAFSPDGQRLATASQDGFARIWEIDRRELETELGHDGWVLSVAFSPDGRLLASAGRDRTARVWAVATGEPQETIQHRGPVRRVAFSPDGRWLATASYDNSSQVWQFALEVSDADG